MVLNKILCDMAVEDFLPEETELSDLEKEEAAHLCQVVIDNWKVLKNTSVDGFRKAFLQRDGLLSKDKDGWLFASGTKGHGYFAGQIALAGQRHQTALERLYDQRQMVSNHTILLNAQDLQQEIDWLRTILRVRSALNANQATDYEDVFDIDPPSLQKKKSKYAHFVSEHKLGFEERFLLILTAVPHINPNCWMSLSRKQRYAKDLYRIRWQDRARSLRLFANRRTVMFVLAGDDLSRRFDLMKYFERDHFFVRNRILWLEEPAKGEPVLNGVLTISRDILDLITTGELTKPTFGSEFPRPPHQHADGVGRPRLENHTKVQIEEIETWLEYKQTLMEDWG